MKNFTTELHHRIVAALTVDYPALCACCRDAPRACALVTDSNAMTLFFTLDTHTSSLSPAGRWSPSEWGYGHHQLDRDHLKYVSDFLAAQQERFAPDGLPIFCEQVHAVMISALKTLCSNGLFGKRDANDTPVVFASISDDSSAEYLENRSSAQLNPSHRHQAFLHRFDTDASLRQQAEDIWRRKDYAAYLALMAYLQGKPTPTETRKIFFAQRAVPAKQQLQQNGFP